MASSNHWYDVSGPEIVSAHDSTLRDARKRNLFISPTSIIKNIRANPMLARWIMKETVKACDENPRYANEDIDFYVRRVDELSGKIASDAADRGTAIHKILEEYPSPCKEPSLQPWYDCFSVWYGENIERTIHNEIKLADMDVGVAGTCDLIAMHKEHGLSVLDYKTKRKMTGDIFHWSYAMQLSLYAKAYQKKHGLMETPKCISIAIDSTEPAPPVAHVWTYREIEDAYSDFLCMAWSFFLEKDYWPVGEWRPQFRNEKGVFHV